MLVGRVLRPHVRVHLDLVELVHAEHPPRVLARRAGLAPEAGRVARVAQRELVRGQDLVHVHPGQRDLGRARQVQVVPLDAVDVDLVRRQEAGSVHRLLADEHRRQHGDETLLDESVEREAVERQLHQREVPDAIDEPGAGEPCGALGVDPTELLGEVEVVERVEGEVARLAPAADLDRVLLVPAVRDGRVGRIRDTVPVLLHRRLRPLELVLERLQLALEPRQLLELLRRRLALQLRARAQLVDLRLQPAPLLVGSHQLVEDLFAALARDRRPERVRIGASGLEVDHAAESR